MSRENWDLDASIKEGLNALRDNPDMVVSSRAEQAGINLNPDDPLRPQLSKEFESLALGDAVWSASRKFQIFIENRDNSSKDIRKLEEFLQENTDLIPIACEFKVPGGALCFHRISSQKESRLNYSSNANPGQWRPLVETKQQIRIAVYPCLVDYLNFLMTNFEEANASD